MQNQTNQGQKVGSLVLNSLAKWAIFILNGSRFKGLGGTPLRKLPLSVPPGRFPELIQLLMLIFFRSCFFRVLTQIPNFL